MKKRAATSIQCVSDAVKKRWQTFGGITSEPDRSKGIGIDSNRSNVMSATKIKEEPCDVFETQLAVFEQDVLLPRSSCRQTTASLQCQSSDGVTHDGNVVCSDIQIDYTGNFVDKPYIKSESCAVETAENISLQRVRIKCEVDEVVASSTGEATQWMVCENDALGGVWKVENTDWPSETYAVQDCTDNTEDVDKPHVCSMCGKLFVSYSQLEEHMCSKVGMLYKQSSSLTTSDMHGDKTTCGGSSAHSGGRTAGERREGDEETSTCFLCGKSFAEHSKGEQLYTCGSRSSSQVESEMQNVFCNCIVNKDKLRFVMKNRKSSEFLLRCPEQRVQPSPNNSAVDFRKMHDQASNTLNVAGERRLECSSPPLIRSLSQEAALHQRVRACMSE
ncbi:hypothetical protein LSAT2_014622 [Lamellibrachia satsuma]|nr:hypothetical protein LSAT2_014622 [Lamellibrachia satsuma]